MFKIAYSIVLSDAVMPTAVLAEGDLPVLETCEFDVVTAEQ